MHRIRYLTAPLLLAVATANLGALETAEEWDVNAMPGKPRQVDIDTDSGTWMSLDVSPDGRTIAFDLLGDIYLLPIDGGLAKSVESGHAWSIQPRFSPDGKEIAYTSDAGGGDNVWIMRVDGSAKRQLTKEDFRLLNNATWSPDARYIAARKHFTTRRSVGTGEIWLYHRDGGSGIAVIERPSETHQKELGEPAFSPDGRFLYFSRDSTPGETFKYAQDSNAQIFEIRRHDFRTGQTESLVTGPGGAVRPEPSPDGRWLAFVRRLEGQSALFLKDLTSGKEMPIYRGLDYDMQEVWAIHGVYPNMGWLPNSSGLLFWAGGKIRRIDIGSRDVSDIEFRVEDTRIIYDPPRPAVEVAPPFFDSKMVRSAAVSPDGTRVVFETMGKLYMKSLPGGEPRPLTTRANDQFEYFPSWSRDGTRIVYVAWTDVGLGNVHVIDVDGRQDARLTASPGHYRTPCFSPDGRAIVYAAVGASRLTSPTWAVETGVFIIDAAGGPARRITPDGLNPHFGGRNDRLYVTRTIDDANALVSLDLNGEAPRTHATGLYLSQYEVAPDDAYLAFRENYHVYVMPLAPGGKPLTLGTSVDAVTLVRASGDGGNYPQWSANGRTLHWTLGPTLFAASVDRLFSPAEGNGDNGYEPPTRGVSLSMQFAADIPDSWVALIGARLYTMASSDGGIIDDGIIIIEGNRIRAVGQRNDVGVPADMQVVDLRGHTVIPGLIDAHAHGSQGDEIIPEQNWINHATLAFGVTTVHDPSNDATEFFAASEMQRAGRILAPRLFSSGDVVYGARSVVFAEVNSLEDAREHVRRLKAQGAISIKNYNQPRRDQRQQIAVAAREENILVVAEGSGLFHLDLSLIADGNSSIEHNIPQAMLYEDVLQFWGKSRVANVPTFVVTYGGLRGEDYWYQTSDVWRHPLLSRFVPPNELRPRAVRRLLAPIAEYHHKRSATVAKLLADRGVAVSIGAHGQREGLASHWEMWTLRLGGMSAVDALRAATIVPATSIGLQNDLGSLQRDKLADLVVIKGAIDDENFQTDRVSMVMLNGRLYDAHTLNETQTGGHRTRPFFWKAATDPVLDLESRQ